MSRFFQESDTDTESDVSEEERKQPSKFQAAAFSDEEEDTKRTIRSAKDKRFEEIQSVIKGLRNSKKIKDVSKVLEEFDTLTKVFSKSQKVIEKEGVPVFYVRCLVEIEDFVNQCWTDKAALSKQNVKSLGSLRSKLRKYVKDYEVQMVSFRENPVMSADEAVEEEGDEDEDEDKSDTDDESEDELKPKKKPTKPVKAAKVEGEDTDSEDMWDSSTDESTSESEDEERYKENPALRFLKKTTDTADTDKAKRPDRKDKKPRTRREKVKVVGEDGFTTMVDKPKLFTKETDINIKVVLEKLREIVALRGKKSTDRQEQIELVEELRVVARRANLGPAIEIKLMLSLVSFVFDYNPNVATSMKPLMWKRLLDTILELVKMLNEHPEIEVGDTVPDDDENYEDTNRAFRVSGSPLALVERMDEEFTKVLQNCDAHSPEYVENLKSELKVGVIMEQMQAYLENQQTRDLAGPDQIVDAHLADLCRIYERRIAHIYYKIDYKFMDVLKKGERPEPGHSLEVMDRLCAFVFNNDKTDRIRLRAILMRTYHLALHDQWHAARDLMLMSKTQETIDRADPASQILYNRAMVQVGISAFRQGNINEAHNALMDIQSSGRPKELLAQGLLPQRQNQERSAEQEKIEKRRQMPFHMHINLDVLECVYLVSAMFIEVPYLAAHENDQRRRIISKYFYHSMKTSERHSLQSPPETLPEYVIAASKAMKMGDWKKCRAFVLSEKLSKRVWDFFYQPEKIKALLERRIQECSLRCFMFTNSAFYDAISLHILSEMFELSKEDILSLIGKMIVSEDLAASVDSPSQTVIMHRTEPSRVQQLSLQLADKLISMVENNERQLEMKNPQGQRRENKGNWQPRHGGHGGGHGGGQYQNRNQDRRHQNQDRHHEETAY